MNSRGKKVLDIEWEKDGVKVKVPVKAFMKTDYSPDSDPDGMKMYFRAVYEDAGLDIESTDINIIKREVKEKLDLWYTVDWKIFMLVKVGGGQGGQYSSNFEIEFETEFYAIGTDSQGTQLHMEIPRPEDFSETKKFTRWGGHIPKKGMPETGVQKKDFYNDKPTTSSLVPATPENVAAADNFKKAMGALLEKMHYHFAPTHIEAILAKGAGLFSLGMSK